MFQLTGIIWLFFLPSFIHLCTIEELLSKQSTTDVIFTGRILSLHQWSINYPYTAFVWVSHIFHGETRLLQHYKWSSLQRPLYLIVDHLNPCENDTPLKYYEVKIFGIQLRNSRFYSNLPPLSITVANMKTLKGKKETLIVLLYFLLSIDSVKDSVVQYEFYFLARSVNVHI